MELFSNPKGIESYSPGLQGTRYPGWQENESNPEGVEAGESITPFGAKGAGVGIQGGRPRRKKARRHREESWRFVFQMIAGNLPKVPASLAHPGKGA